MPDRTRPDSGKPAEAGRARGGSFPPPRLGAGPNRRGLGAPGNGPQAPPRHTSAPPLAGNGPAPLPPPPAGTPRPHPWRPAGSARLGSARGARRAAAAGPWIGGKAVSSRVAGPRAALRASCVCVCRVPSRPSLRPVS